MRTLTRSILCPVFFAVIATLMPTSVLCSTGGKQARPRPAAKADNQILNDYVTLAAGYGHSWRFVRLATQLQPSHRLQGHYPELTLGLRLSPWAHTENSHLRWLTIQATFRRQLKIKGSLDGSGRALAARAQRLLTAVGWSHTVAGGRARLRYLLGYGFNDFSLSRNPLFVDLVYQFFRLGLGVRVPIVTALLALDAAAEYRPVFSVGSRAEQALGPSINNQSLAARLGLEGRHPIGLYYAVAAEAALYRTQFAGRGALAGPPRAGFADRQEQTKSVDVFVRLTALIGYAF